MKAPNLEYVYDMSWAEFQIRLFAFKRSEIREFEKLRELMWVTYIAPHLDPKKMAKTKDGLMKLPNDKEVERVSDEQRELFIKEYKKWQNSK